VEATLLDVVRTGSHEECETFAGGPRCGVVDDPEILILTDMQVKKGKFNVGQKGSGVTSRKDSCLAGVLMLMNGKPELRSLGKRIRIYGNNVSIAPYVHPGSLLSKTA
jgi:hypothetical protein